MLKALWGCTILRFLLANPDRISDATFLLVNKIKIIGMLMNIVHRLVYKNIQKKDMEGVWQVSWLKVCEISDVN